MGFADDVCKSRYFQYELINQLFYSRKLLLFNFFHLFDIREKLSYRSLDPAMQGGWR
jgi:hypothetical protein